MSAAPGGPSSAVAWWGAMGVGVSGVVLHLTDPTFDASEITRVLPYAGRSVALVLLGIVSGVLVQARPVLKSLAFSLLCLAFGDRSGALRIIVPLHLVLTPVVAAITLRALGSPAPRSVPRQNSA